MRRPDQFSWRELVKIVELIRDWLFLNEDDLEAIRKTYGSKFANRIKRGPSRESPKSSREWFEYFDPEKAWDSDVLEGIADVLTSRGIRIDKPMTVDDVYKDPTPTQNWKNDAIQFTRLLAELRALGLDQTIREAEWRALEESMDLRREKIMEIFHRADKEWERIKKELRDEG